MKWADEGALMATGVPYQLDGSGYAGPKVEAATREGTIAEQVAEACSILSRCHGELSRLNGEAIPSDPPLGVPHQPGLLESVGNLTQHCLGLEKRLGDLGRRIGRL